MKNKQYDAFSDALHRLLKAHTKHDDVPMGKLIVLAIGMNNLAEMSDEQLLESLENFYA